MNMRKAPTYIAALFLLITLFRVASFSADAMKAGWVLGVSFSAGLGIAVFVAAYHTRVHAVDKNGEETRASKQSRETAMLALVLFTIADGLFNLWEVKRNVKEADMQFAATLYGLFPTAAAALLGFVQGKIDKLPVPPKNVKKPAVTAQQLFLAALARAMHIDTQQLAAQNAEDTSNAHSIEVLPAAQAALPAAQDTHSAANAESNADVVNGVYSAVGASDSTHAAAAQVTLACVAADCAETFTADTARAANAKRAAHVRWHHPQLLANAQAQKAADVHADA